MIVNGEEAEELKSLEIEILYKLASLDKLEKKYGEMETHLLAILNHDTLWKDGASDFVKAAMKRTIENEGIDKFLLMYRYKNPDTERAHRLLGEYYFENGRHAKAAEHFIFSFLINSTIMIDAVNENSIDITEWTTLKNLTASVSKRLDIKEFMDNTDYYRTCYYLGASFLGEGKNTGAQNMLNFLSGEEEAGEWMRRAKHEQERK
jgi:hypothetical protein